MRFLPRSFHICTSPILFTSARSPRHPHLHIPSPLHLLLFLFNTQSRNPQQQFIAMATQQLASTLVRQNAVRQALSAASRALSSTQVIGESGRGLVRATLSGDGRLVDLNVSPSIGREGPRAIEELVSAAVNRAHDQLKEETKKQIMSSLPPNVDPNAILRALR